MTKYKKGQTGEFMYRDGSNYKFFFEAELPNDMKINDETTYEKLGYDRKSFHKDIVGYKYDKTSDHNIVELIEVNNK